MQFVQCAQSSHGASRRGVNKPISLALGGWEAGRSRTHASVNVLNLNVYSDLLELHFKANRKLICSARMRRQGLLSF